MTTDTLVLFGLQGVLGVLVALGLRWTADVARSVDSLRTDIARISEGLVGSNGRISAIEQITRYEQQAASGRLEIIGGHTSDLRVEVKRLATILSMCKHCPQADHKDSGHD